MTVKENNILILFTRGYPYSAVSESFLDPEIPYLSSAFEKIIIVPTKITSPIETTRRKLPSNVIVDNSYLHNIPVNKYRNKLLIKMSLLQNVIKSRHFYSEVANNIPLIFHRSAMKCLIKHLSSAYQIEKWLKKYIRDNNLDLSKTIFYTYWLIGATTGVAFVKMQYPEIKLISRAHGWDLYLERYEPLYIPFRKKIFRYLNQLFLISDYGREYVLNLYPSVGSICKVARLGVPDPHFSTYSSKDAVFRIVSCSYVYPVKRIELLIRGLAELGKLKPDQRFYWVHIGNGPLLQKLKDQAQRVLPKNIEYNFLGFFPHENVMQYYKSNSIDIFMNTSSSEGIPVTIMEVQSCGIPIIATSVGGIPEIVSENVGVLLSENPTPSEIASAICKLLADPKKFMEKKQKSKKNWETNYDAEQNFSAFAQQLKEI